MDRLEADPTYSGRYGNDLVKAYRKAMQHIRAATDERTLYGRRAFRFEKLSGDREGQFSLRLNNQWRLILKITGEAPKKIINVLEIADYH